MNKIKSFPWFVLLLFIPIFAIMQVSNGVQTVPKININDYRWTWTPSEFVYNPEIETYYMNEECSKLEIWNSVLLKLDSYKKHVPSCAITEKQLKSEENNQMNENTIVAISWVSVISLIVIFSYSYFKNKLKSNDIKEKREYDLRVKEIELNQTIQLQQAELEKYKTLQLSKTQMDNEHEVALKKLEFDKSLDARDFMLTVTKDEREYLLKQRELDIQEGKPSTSFMDMIDSNKDVQLRLKK